MKRYWWLILLTNAVVLCAAPISSAGQLQPAGGSWLDHPLPNWNTNGQAGNSSDDSADALFGKKWKLTEIRGNSVKAEPYIEFDREKGRFSGSGGCNRISGGFEVSDNILKLSQVISTKMACLDAAANQTEADFLRELTGALRFEIRDDVLRLYAGDDLVLTFKASPTDAGEGTPTAAVTGRVGEVSGRGRLEVLAASNTRSVSWERRHPCLL
jgi:heat shock protein HslJ